MGLKKLVNFNSNNNLNKYPPVSFGNLTDTSSPKTQETSFKSNQTNLGALEKGTLKPTKKKMSETQKYWLSVSAVAGALLIAVFTLGKNTKAVAKATTSATKNKPNSIPYVRTTPPTPPPPPPPKSGIFAKMRNAIANRYTRIRNWRFRRTDATSSSPTSARESFFKRFFKRMRPATHNEAVVPPTSTASTLPTIDNPRRTYKTTNSTPLTASKSRPKRTGVKTFERNGFQVTERRNDDLLKKSTITAADGTEKTILKRDPCGFLRSRTITAPDGSKKTTYFFNDGTIEKIVKTSKDGVQSTKLPSGLRYCEPENLPFAEYEQYFTAQARRKLYTGKGGQIQIRTVSTTGTEGTKIEHIVYRGDRQVEKIYDETSKVDGTHNVNFEFYKKPSQPPILERELAYHVESDQIYSLTERKPANIARLERERGWNTLAEDGKPCLIQRTVRFDENNNVSSITWYTSVEKNHSQGITKNYSLDKKVQNVEEIGNFSGDATHILPDELNFKPVTYN